MENQAVVQNRDEMINDMIRTKKEQAETLEKDGRWKESAQLWEFVAQFGAADLKTLAQAKLALVETKAMAESFHGEVDKLLIRLRGRKRRGRPPQAEAPKPTESNTLWLSAKALATRLGTDLDTAKHFGEFLVGAKLARKINGPNPKGQTGRPPMVYDLNYEGLAALGKTISTLVDKDTPKK